MGTPALRFRGGQLLADSQVIPILGSFKGEGFSLELQFSEGRIEGNLEFQREFHLEQISLDFEADSDFVFFKNGFQSWSPSLEINQEHFRRPLIPSLEIHYEDPAFLHGVPYTEKGHFITYLRFPGHYLLLNPADLPATLTHFRRQGRRLQVIIEVGRHVLGTFPFLRLEMTDSPTLPFPNQLDSSRQRVLPIPRPRVFGWTSWYRYYTKLTPQDVRLNLEQASRFPYPLTYFQIDDAWEEAVGNWQEKQSWKGQLASLAREILEHGYAPGIWLAPFVAESKARINRERNWFLHNHRGRKATAGFNPGWSGPFYALDPTHPGVRQYLLDSIGRLREMGFSLFKFDFLYSLAIAGEGYKEGLSRKERITSGLELLRQAAGGAKILGCGGPPLLAPVWEYYRVGPDVSERWHEPLTSFIGHEGRPEAFNALRNTLSRAFLDGHFWQNDPDALILRRGHLTPAQQRTLILSDFLLARFLFYSDPPSEVPPENLALLKSLQPFLELRLRKLEWESRVFHFQGRTDQLQLEGWINLYPQVAAIQRPSGWEEFAPARADDSLQAFETRLFTSPAVLEEAIR